MLKTAAMNATIRRSHSLHATPISISASIRSSIAIAIRRVPAAGTSTEMSRIRRVSHIRIIRNTRILD